jgi:hypothetical protein
MEPDEYHERRDTLNHVLRTVRKKRIIEKRRSNLVIPL